VLGGRSVTRQVGKAVRRNATSAWRLVVHEKPALQQSEDSPRSRPESDPTSEPSERTPPETSAPGRADWRPSRGCHQRKQAGEVSAVAPLSPPDFDRYIDSIPRPSVWKLVVSAGCLSWLPPSGGRALIPAATGPQAMSSGPSASQPRVRGRELHAVHRG
jgi:hypothetical protein